MRSRSMYSESYSRSTPFVSVSNSAYKNPKQAAYFDERNYKNNKVNHAYSFGGKTHARMAWKDPNSMGVANDNPLLRPSTASSYGRKEVGYDIRAEVDDNQVYQPDSRRQGISPNKPPRAAVMRYSNKPASRQSGQSMQSQMRANTAERQGRQPAPAQMKAQDQIQFARPGTGSRPTSSNRPLSSEGPTSSKRSIARPGSGYRPQSSQKPPSAHVDFLEINPEEAINSADELEQEEVESVADLPERPVTSSSWRTTASQKQYIEMLETLLKEEREKRLVAEDQLNSVS